MGVFTTMLCIQMKLAVSVIVMIGSVFATATDLQPTEMTRVDAETVTAGETPSSPTETADEATPGSPKSCSNFSVNAVHGSVCSTIGTETAGDSSPGPDGAADLPPPLQEMIRFVHNKGKPDAFCTGPLVSDLSMLPLTRPLNIGDVDETLCPPAPKRTDIIPGRTIIIPEQTCSDLSSPTLKKHDRVWATLAPCPPDCDGCPATGCLKGISLGLAELTDEKDHPLSSPTLKKHDRVWATLAPCPPDCDGCPTTGCLKGISLGFAELLAHLTLGNTDE